MRRYLSVNEYLWFIYGDYVQLFPEEKRLANAQIAFWNE